MNPSVLRIFVSKPKVVEWNGRLVATSIFKEPIEGTVRARRLNLDGDEQADLTVHGGRDKAVYAYPIEQYEYWKKELPERDLDWGSFGENLTISGFDENSVFVGDKLRIGTALFVVTQPRMPCFKLGIRLNDSSMIKRFYKSGKWGVYLAVLEEGDIKTGDEIVRAGDDGIGVTLADVSECFLNPDVDPDLISRVLDSNLAEQMKNHLEYQLERKGS